MQTFFKHDMPSRVDRALEKEAEDAATERRITKEIDARDHRVCRCCGTRSHPDVIGLTTRGHRHHLVYASAGGSDEAFNRVTLCAVCHNDEHKDRLRFTSEGGPYVGLDANRGLEFWRKDSDGLWFLQHREIAPFVIERD